MPISSEKVSYQTNHKVKKSIKYLNSPNPPQLHLYCYTVFRLLTAFSPKLQDDDYDKRRRKKND